MPEFFCIWSIVSHSDSTLQVCMFLKPSWSCRVWECLCVMLLPWQHMMIKSYTSELLWDRQQNPISPLRQWSNQKSPWCICSTCRHSLHQTLWETAICSLYIYNELKLHLNVLDKYSIDYSWLWSDFLSLGTVLLLD